MRYDKAIVFPDVSKMHKINFFKFQNPKKLCLRAMYCGLG